MSPRHPPSRDPRLIRRYLGVAVLLAVLIPLTLGVEAVLVRNVDANTEAIAQGQVDATRRAVQAQLTRLLEAMEADARELAAHPVVRQVLGDPTTRTPTLVRSVLEAVSGTRSLYRRAPTEALELYRPDGALFAWSGFAVPQDRLTLSEGISDTLRTAVAMDGPRRRTITLWLPVRRGDEVIGAVRVMRRAQVSVPVRNQYLQDYNLADEWKDGALPPFSVLFTEGQTRSADASQLLGLDGTLLGWVSVDPPNEGFLTGHVLGLTHGVITFWVVLLVGWLMVGFWYVVDGKTQEASSTESSWRTAGALLVGWCLAWWGLRYGLLAIDVPARWLEAWSPGAALFDPHHLASHVGAGVLGSAGDLIVTAVFAVVLAVAVLRFALARAAAVMRRQARGMSPAGVVGALVLAGLGIAAIAAFSVGARHAVLDATLGYFERSGPIPDRITFVVLMALLAGAFAAIAFAAACTLLARVAVGWTRPPGSQAWKIVLGIACGLLAVIAVTNTLGGTPLWVAITLFALSSVAGALFLAGHRDRWAWPLTFRGMLFSVLVLVTLTYVVMSRADRERENALIEEAAEEFARGQDPRAVYAIEQILIEARSQDLKTELVDVIRSVEKAALAELDNQPAESLVVDSLRTQLPLIQDNDSIRDSTQVALDNLISRLVSGSFLASLAEYSVDLSVLNAQGDTLATYVGDVLPDDGVSRTARVKKDDPLAFDSLRSRYRSQERPGFLVLRAPVGSQRGTYRYAGISPVEASADSLAGWLRVEAMPRLSRPLGETPYPRVLVPARIQDEVGAAMSYSEYDNGVLVRSRGAAPGPFRLDVDVRNAFAGNRTEYWRQEIIEDQPYRAYYQRIPAGEKRERLDAIAVRLPAPSPLDHLFNLLRMTIAGLILGLLVYLGGLPIRRRKGLLPVSRSQFRDQVLSRFLLVGIATVAVTGLIGRQVIVAQNEQNVQDLLRLRLQRVEAAVTADAGPGMPVSSVLGLARADAASAQLGIDLHVYQGYELVSTSRPQLVRQRFIDERLPADVYRALYAEGRRYAFTEGRIGTFTYTIGYKAIADERGRTIGAVAVPTLPEQASIEAGQARMIAYLFGILLVLMLGIFVTTTLLANQLTRPFKRLRAGLKAVGEGQIYEPIPVETQDEMGQLAETFNEMQLQLKESRRQLAQQERELAWREMAQQVAHEIKNPLTPMKLSVQHLRRAHRPADDNAPPEDRKFSRVLDRITTTLIEQIDALSSIAGEFSSFARLPRRNPERLDLNEVVREAAALFDDEASAERSFELTLDLAEEPLFIEADHEELRRAYINLFTNALQAMPNGREGRITVRTRTSGVHAISDVQDNGAGIPEKARARIFQPNFSTKTSGMGLGLAIVKKTIEAGGGAIWFETEEGKGTTFHIRTPLAAESLQEGD